MARPYVITISSEKGGVGKTTLATNLAIYLKGLSEELPVTLFSFDNHFTIDQMFQLGKQEKRPDISELFTGQSVDELVIPGQYGVHFIPSCRNIQDHRNRIETCDQLANILCRSQLGGILIIDTSPIIDPFTQNALYAADRVIVPIKDAASLENCGHLAEFLNQQERPKSVLRLLPCLVDTRIHFDGPFRNSYQLLKAFAINRGYKCYEGYVAKSPKVESLSTNPSGKIYSVITHGRNTDVHLQFMHLARQAYLEYLENGPAWMNQIAKDRTARDEILDHERKKRFSQLDRSCLCCGSNLPGEIVWPGAYLIESADGKLCGFAEDSCFLDLIVQDCYGEQKAKGLEDSLRDLLRETADRSYILLQRTQLPEDESQIDFYRLDENGEKLSGRSLVVKEKGLFNRAQNSRVLTLFRKFSTLQGEKKQQILARRGGENPQELLNNYQYNQFQAVFDKAKIDLAAEAQ